MLVIRREIDESGLRWPPKAEAEESLGLNRDYEDLRGMSVSDVLFILRCEEAFEQALREANDYEAALDVWERTQASEHDPLGPLLGIDPGVASTVAAVSAIGCIPFISCNGGLYGGVHAARHPYVAFFARPDHLRRLTVAAEAADCGLVNDTAGEGALVAYHARIEPLQRFAGYLVNASS